MALGDEDIAGVLADLFALGEAVDVTCGAQTTKGVLLKDHALLSEALEGHQVERVTAVVVEAGTLASLAVDAAVTVDGTAYTVRDVILGDDRGLTTAILT